MANGKRSGIVQKVRELRRLLGGRRAVVGELEATSVSSLKRWEKRECMPLRAHRWLVNEKYPVIVRIEQLILEREKRKSNRKPR